MARGGARSGAGRKAGARNAKTVERIAKAAAAGMLPHEFLCAVAQGHVIGGHTPTFTERLSAARDAAPYYACKLASIEHTGKDGDAIRVDVKNLSDDDLIAIIAGTAGVSGA